MRHELEKVTAEIEKVIVGKRQAIQRILLALLANGHVLLDDVPGVGKTALTVALSRATGLACRRVQFTPDVMPSDLVGFSVFSQSADSFSYRPGALSGINLLLGDEINRASSKTQSALLEAMEERQVTVDGSTYPLETPFLVIATQNSVGAAGTQLLPYAQMDRFLVRLSLGYPDYEAQMTMLRNRQGQEPMDQVQRVLTKEQVVDMQQAVRAVTSKDAVLDYITRLVMASRCREEIEVGISPRGALFLDRMAKAHAWLEGRDYVTGTDVQAVFKDVCSHRVLLRAQAGDKTTETVLDELLKTVENPDRRISLAGLLKR
ncbi:MAG: MoxR family ATPase [Clostridia bacterium]|nr:MoxR family ATPase [Clostridia bacterium]